MPQGLMLWTIHLLEGDEGGPGRAMRVPAREVRQPFFRSMTGTIRRSYIHWELWRSSFSGWP